MKTPMEDLKEGLLNKDWQRIVSAYTMLTGEVIKVSPDGVSSEAERNYAAALLDISEICQECLDNVATPHKDKKDSVEQESAPSKAETNKEPIVRPTPRPAPRIYKLICSECEKEYESTTQTGRDHGGRCNPCLKALVAGRKR